VNQHKPPPCSGGLRQTLHCLAMLFLSGLVPESTLAESRQRLGIRAPGDWRTSKGEPYLAVIGAPGLRFREPEPEPALPPVAVGPPVPGLNAAEAAVAVANVSALRVPATEEAGPVRVTAPPHEPAPKETAKSVPPAILPDDTRPRVRAEDFLPFFQIPGTIQTGEAPVVPGARGAPGPAPLPPSAATYTQSPR
jgi:hypothetical protein